MADMTRLHDALVDRLVADASPVRRLWPPAVRLVLWLGLAAAIAGLAAHAGVRPDVSARLHEPLFALELVVCGLAAALAAALALRAAVPGCGPRRAAAAATLGAAAVALALAVRAPALGGVSLAEFVAIGADCSRRTVLLASLPWAALLVAVRRGAPLTAAAAGALTGAAAFLMAFAVMRLACPMDEALHLFVWHVGPLVAGAGLSALVGLVWLRRWRLGRARP
jgi:hypothetical protein